MVSGQLLGDATSQEKKGKYICVMINIIKCTQKIEPTVKWLVRHNTSNLLLPPANEVCEGYVFTRVCHSVYRGSMHGWQCVCGGGHAWQGGMHGRGHAWQGGSWQGACIAGLCMAGGMHGPPSTMGYGWSMRGQYTSYWNAFLFGINFAKNCMGGQ